MIRSASQRLQERAESRREASAAGSRHRLAYARAALAAGVFVLRLPSLTEPPWFSDDGIFTAVATGMAKGMPLYARIFDDQPPGIYWLYRLLLWLGAGDHHVVVQGAATIAAISAALLTFEISRRLFPLQGAIVAGATCGIVLSIPSLDGDLMNVELAALPFFLGCLLMAFRNDQWAPIAVGVLLGIALIIRPSFGLDALTLLVVFLGFGERPWFRLGLTALGVALVIAAAAAALVAQGAWAAYWRDVVPLDRSYLLWYNGGTLLPLYVRLAILAAAALFAIWKFRSPEQRLIVVWLATSVAASGLTPRGFLHYGQEAVPSLSVAAAWLASNFRWHWLTLPPAVALTVIGAIGVAFLSSLETNLVSAFPTAPPQYNFAFAELPGYYENWLAYAAQRESWRSYADRFPLPVHQQDDEVALLKTLAGTSHPRLLVLGNQPWLYVLSELTPATRYLPVSSIHALPPQATSEVKATLAAGCAGLVVVIREPERWSAAIRDGGYQLVAATPWPTYRSAHASIRCP